MIDKWQKPYRDSKFVELVAFAKAHDVALPNRSKQSVWWRLVDLGLVVQRKWSKAYHESTRSELADFAARNGLFINPTDSKEEVWWNLVDSGNTFLWTEPFETTTETWLRTFATAHLPCIDCTGLQLRELWQSLSFHRLIHPSIDPDYDDDEEFENFHHAMAA